MSGFDWMAPTPAVPDPPKELWIFKFTAEEVAVLRWLFDQFWTQLPTGWLKAGLTADVKLEEATK